MIFDYNRVVGYDLVITPFLDKPVGVTALEYGDRRAQIGSEAWSLKLGCLEACSIKGGG